MKKTLLVIEIIGVVVALVFGYLWIIDPDGPFEPITFMALLVGSTIVEIIRRHVADESDSSNAEIAKLQVSVDEILNQMRDSGAPNKPEPAASVAPDNHDEDPIDDPLTTRIRELLDARRNVVVRLQTLAELRKLSIDVAKPKDACEKLKVTSSFSDAVVEVLNYTADLTGKDSVDLQHSEWIDGLSYAAVCYLDHIIGNVEKAA